jgi:hypothetical protein
LYINRLDKNILRRNIEIVADTLTKVVFELLDDNHFIFTGDYKVLEGGQIEQLIKYFKANSRFPTKLIKGSSSLKELTKIFTKLMPNITAQSFEYKGIELATNTPAKMKVTKSKSRLLDMFLFVVIALYLGSLYIYMNVSVLYYI